VSSVCILAMIPLVKVRPGISRRYAELTIYGHVIQLHDLSTCELALRIGGSKAGLLNASMVRVFLFVMTRGQAKEVSSIQSNM